MTAAWCTAQNKNPLIEAAFFVLNTGAPGQEETFPTRGDQPSESVLWLGRKSGAFTQEQTSVNAKKMAWNQHANAHRGGPNRLRRIINYSWRGASVSSTPRTNLRLAS